jgi:hypothetical protein
MSSSLSTSTFVPSFAGSVRALLLAVTLLSGGILSQNTDVNDWSTWECPGFPCFIINPYDEKNTTVGRIETCGPVDSLSVCNELDKDQPPHPCHDVNYMCEQRGCVQGNNANCKKFCPSLLPLYQRDCNNACDRWCPTGAEKSSQLRGKA